MANVYFSDEHEYIKVEGNVGTVGITNYAQEALGDVVYAEPPAQGRVLRKGEEAGVVESVKSASEIYAPVSGEVMEINPELAEAPSLINEDAENEGWIFKIKIADAEELKELKTEEQYQAYIGTL